MQDLRYAIRSLGRSKGFTTAAVATLALGISVNTAIFSVVDGVLLRPLPYRDAGRLAMLWTTNPRQNAFQLPTGFLNVQDWRQTHSFEGMTCYRDEPLVLREEPEPEALDTSFVSPEFFDLLGARPALGRVFTAKEAERGDRLAVLGYGLWQRRFGGSPAVLGRTLRLEDRQVTVVGVLPRSFRPLAQTTQIWMPHTSATFFNDIRTDRSSKFGWNVLARLRPGVALPEAQTEMDAIAARLAAAWPETNRGAGVRVVSLLEQVTGRIRLALDLLLGAVALVLLIACANLGSLLLARAAGREREMAIRAALGAGRARLIRQLLTESAVLAAAAAVAAFGLASLGLRALLAAAPAGTPRLQEVSLDLRALVFTFAISLASALLFAVGPALRQSRRAMAPAQRAVGGSREIRRFRRVLVIAEYALTVVLLAGAGLLIRSLSSVLRVDPGFRASGVLTVELHSPGRNDPLTPPRFRQLVQELEALPGVQAAGGISRYFQGNIARGELTIAGRPPLDPSRWREVSYEVIAGDYLRAIGVPLQRGRSFSPADGPDSPQVALVNDAFVRAFLPGADPLGAVFRRAGDATPYTIVGVVGDTRRQDIAADPIPEVLWPHTQRPWGLNLAVRTAADPLALAAAVRTVIHRVDGAIVVRKVSTLDRQLGRRVAQRSFETGLMGAFSALALLLAALGIYALMHYSVAERTREIGVRLALGATSRDLFSLVWKEAARLACFGMAAGLPAAVIATRALGSLLYGVSPLDPLTYLAVFVVLTGATLAASLSPALRAAASDPQAALRCQ